MRDAHPHAPARGRGGPPEQPPLSSPAAIRAENKRMHVDIRLACKMRPAGWLCEIPCLASQTGRVGGAAGRGRKQAANLRIQQEVASTSSRCNDDP